MIRHVDYVQNDWLAEVQRVAGRITLRDGPSSSVAALMVEGYAMAERGAQVVQILFTHMAHLREELYTQGLEEPDYEKRCELLTATLPFLLERMGERFGNAYFFCTTFHGVDECPFQERQTLPMTRRPYTLRPRKDSDHDD